MKWMRWSYDDLLSCPADLVMTIVEMMNEEAAHGNYGR